VSHPHLLVLSQLADHELAAPEAAVIEAHVAGCPSCGTRLGRIARALAGAVSAARGVAPGLAPRTPACPSPSAVAGWQDPLLPAAERTVLARHLESCDACLDEALAANRLLARLDATPPLPVPAALRARVAGAWPEPAADAALSRLVVRVTRRGVELLESHLLAPLRDLAQVPLALPAMRGSATAAGALSFTLRAPAATITATIEPADESVGLVLRIDDLAGAGLAGERVFLRRHGRSIFSARTGDDGALRLPGVERGVYEVACPGIGTAFRLDLRA
jgi:anti-sigma factor RsiW